VHITYNKVQFLQQWNNNGVKDPKIRLILTFSFKIFLHNPIYMINIYNCFHEIIFN
jgi:hypothetical protein